MNKPHIRTLWASTRGRSASEPVLGQSLDVGAIVTAVVTLGHEIGLQVTAEGVETADQEDFLRSAGCNVLQGFLYSHAVPAHQLRGSIERRLGA